MSSNVWFREIEEGLIKEILKTVRITGRGNSQLPLEKGRVFVRKPEDEFRVEMFPCISIYNTFSKFDVVRYNPNPVFIRRKDKVAEYEKSAIPYSLLYQIDFWAEYNSDMNLMIKSWLQTHFRQFNLDVVDDGGVKRNISCFGNKKALRKLDFIINEKRLYHSALEIEVFTELDDNTRFTMPIVIERDITVEKNNGG